MATPPRRFNAGPTQVSRDPLLVLLRPLLLSLALLSSLGACGPAWRAGASAGTPSSAGMLGAGSLVQAGP
ncbi:MULTISPECIES: hypothetical protein [Aphanothece]|uniref:hypothetical protein n=1 Tax=Aphanothece TaxID=1121 RepID=UPI00398E8911